MIQKLQSYGFVDEEHGLLSVSKIKSTCEEGFKDYNIEYCYLFGSYAKGEATEKSDVDLLISTSLSGMKFYGLTEAIREALRKRVDLLNVEQLNANPELAKEILRDGIRIPVD